MILSYPELLHWQIKMSIEHLKTKIGIVTTIFKNIYSWKTNNGHKLSVCYRVKYCYPEVNLFFLLLKIIFQCGAKKRKKPSILHSLKTYCLKLPRGEKKRTAKVFSEPILISARIWTIMIRGHSKMLQKWLNQGITQPGHPLSF